MKTTTIEGYLIQSKLENFLKEVMDIRFIGREKSIEGSRRRFDCLHRALNDKIVFTEFDGEQHYRSALDIKIDEEKDGLVSEVGGILVRIPYWVQLTTETYKHYFGFDGSEVEIIQDYKHGFIHEKATYPASYCELGIDRFWRELIALPKQVRADVVESLKDGVEKHGIKYVIPSPIRDLIMDTDWLKTDSFPLIN